MIQRQTYDGEGYVNVIAATNWPASYSKKMKMDCIRELDKQKAFAYLMLGITALYLIYFFIGLFGDAFLPLNGFHRFALCALEIDFICVGLSAFCMIYFANFVDVRCARRSAAIDAGALGICCVINIGLLIWMCFRRFDPFVLASIICSFISVLGGILLTSSYYKAMTNPEKVVMLLVEKGEVKRIKVIQDDITEVEPVAVDQKEPEVEPNEPNKSYGISNDSAGLLNAKS